VILAAAAVSFAGIASHSLWTPDEPRDAAIGKAMWASGDLAMPRLNGSPFLEKPPLAWWAQVAAFRTLGVSDAAARVPMSAAPRQATSPGPIRTLLHDSRPS
jgi:4-amino-4-deoxy-L-arabinose transferase-like glycosyltransferase